jgi:hypothetical protein
MKTHLSLRLLAMFALALPLTACPTSTGDDDDDSAQGDDDDDSTPGATEIAATSPADGDQNFYYRSCLWVEFSGAVEDAEISLADADGAAVAGTNTLNDDASVVTFCPGSALGALIEYTASVSWDSATGDGSWSFRTSDLGTPTGAEPPADGSFLMDLASATFIEPAGIGGVIGSFLSDPIAMTAAYDGSSLSMIGALVSAEEDPPVQDLCNQTLGLEATIWEDPYFQVGPADLSFEVEGIAVNVAGLEITGTFREDYSAFGGATFRGGLDTRALDTLVDETGTEGAACDMIGAFGISCQPCPDGSGDFCIDLHAVDIEGVYNGSLTIQPRSAEDVAADPACGG